MNVFSWLLMNIISWLTGNLTLSLAVLAWAIAQVLKTVISFAQSRKWDAKLLLSGGGMPSSHSASVCACASSIGMLCGWREPVFALAVVVAIVVMYDAFNVRRAAGEQAKVLNIMMERWNDPEVFNKDLKELLGHTPLQVLMGAILGIAVGIGGAWLFG